MFKLHLLVAVDLFCLYGGHFVLVMYVSPEENSVTSAADERRSRNVSNFLIIVVLLLFVCLMKAIQMTNLELGTSVFPSLSIIE